MCENYRLRAAAQDHKLNSTIAEANRQSLIATADAYSALQRLTGAMPAGEMDREIENFPAMIDCAIFKRPARSVIDLITQSATQVPTPLSTKALLGFAKPATPDTFRGLNTDKISVWLKEVENYLTQCGTHDNAWVGIAQTFLKGQAMTVWTDTSARVTEPPTWQTFKQ